MSEDYCQPIAKPMCIHRHTEAFYVAGSIAPVLQAFSSSGCSASGFVSIGPEAGQLAPGPRTAVFRTLLGKFDAAPIQKEMNFMKAVSAVPVRRQSRVARLLGRTAITSQRQKEPVSWRRKGRLSAIV